MKEKNNLIIFPSTSAIDTLKRIMISAESAASHKPDTTTQQLLECMLRIEAFLKKQAQIYNHKILRFQ